MHLLCIYTPQTVFPRTIFAGEMNGHHGHRTVPGRDTGIRLAVGGGDAGALPPGILKIDPEATVETAIIQ